MRTWFSRLLALMLMAPMATAWATEPDRVVVRNRLYSPAGHLEAGGQVGFSVINRLVSHTNFQGALAYDFTDAWAVEVLGGYAYSAHTDTADQVTTEGMAKYKPEINPTANDFPDLWQMRWNAAAGVRWAPIYGKISLLSEIPVHFQAYLAVGAGATGLHRVSVDYCLAPPAAGDPNDPATVCPRPLTQDRVAPLGEFGGGLRFFLGQKAALRLEARDYAFPDQYFVNIQRAQAMAGDPHAGSPASSPGFTHIVLMTVGLSYLF